MKFDSARIVLPLCGVLLALAGVSTLVAQNQPPSQPAEPAQAASDEDRVEVVIPDTGAIRRQLEMIIPQGEAPAPQQPLDPLPPNPFAGRVVVLETASSLYPPYEDVFLESIGGEQFFVVEGPDGPASHEFWLSVDAVQSIRVFDNMREAERFLREAGINR